LAALFLEAVANGPAAPAERDSARLSEIDVEGISESLP
jgi:hypothetical protein